MLLIVTYILKLLFPHLFIFNNFIKCLFYIISLHTFFSKLSIFNVENDVIVACNAHYIISGCFYFELSVQFISWDSSPICQLVIGRSSEVEAEQTKWKFLFKQNLLQQPKNIKTRILFQELAINGLWEIYCYYISRKTSIRLIKT